MSTPRWLGSAVAGLSATLLMEQASSWLYERQQPRTREREEQLRTEMPTTVLARKAAGLMNRELDDAQAQRLGMLSHYAFGAAGGPAAKLLGVYGVPPVKAALGIAAAMSVVVDEGMNTCLKLTPPPRDFPWQAHVRGAAAHAAYGLALGLLLAAGNDP